MVLTIKLDLHNHFTTLSKVLDPDRVADRVRESLGEGGICALVNYDDKRFEAFSQKAESIGIIYGNAVYFPDRKVTVIKGEEVPTQQGDLLVLGLEEGRHLTQGKELGWTISQSIDNRGIVIIPHPYFHSEVGKYLQANPDLFKDVDALEIHNGNAKEKFNNLAEELWVGHMNMNSIGGIVSSDGHSFREVGSSYSEFYGFPFHNSTTLKEGLRSTIKQVALAYKRTYSTRGLLGHSVIIGSMIIAQKLNINFSRGDNVALR